MKKKTYSEKYPKHWYQVKMEMEDGKIISPIYKASHPSKVRNNLQKRMDIKKIISIVPFNEMP